MPETSSPTGLIARFQTQLEHDWRRYRGLEGDDSARGGSYEEALGKLLGEYFGGRFDVLTNCSVMDTSLNCFDTFEEGAQNEIDVVCMFSHTSPRMILREGEVTWIPLEGVSMLCEVKSRVDKGRLKSDLRKLETLRELETEPEDRFATKIQGEYTVDHQLHCLIYDQASISDDTLSEILSNSDSWDLLLVVESDTLIINNTLPAVRLVQGMAIGSQIFDQGLEFDEEKKAVIPGANGSTLSVDRGLAWFIFTISSTIPSPISVSASTTLVNLLQEMITGVKQGAYTNVDETDLIEWESADLDDSEE